MTDEQCEKLWCAAELIAFAILYQSWREQHSKKEAFETTSEELEMLKDWVGP
jgi:hypothetical protein